MEVSRFAAAHPDVPVCLVDVIRERSLAQSIAEALSVPHASPQVIVLRAGMPVWTASHRGIRAETLAEGIRSTGAVAGRADD
jgi:bacillithiol system protein YtxJ